MDRTTGTSLNIRRSGAGFDLSHPDRGEFQRLAADLTSDEREVILQHGSEALFCGVFNAHKGRGTYTCRLCGLPLFRSGAKFESGSGWPSFFDPIDRAHIRFVEDRSYGMVRTEIRCDRCDGHLGHVFPDGPPPTGERYCMNSISMSFVPEGEPLPDRLGRGAPEGQPLARVGRD